MNSFKTHFIISSAAHIVILGIIWHYAHTDIALADYKIVQLDFELSDYNSNHNNTYSAPKVIPKKQNIAQNETILDTDNVSSGKIQTSSASIKISEKTNSNTTGNTNEKNIGEMPFLPSDNFLKVKKLPSFILAVKPIYPKKAKVNGIESSVLTKVYIDAKGKTKHVIIITSGGKDFDNAVVEALQKSKFRPAISKNGKTIPSRVRIPFKFELE